MARGDRTGAELLERKRSKANDPRPPATAPEPATAGGTPPESPDSTPGSSSGVDNETPPSAVEARSSAHRRAAWSPEHEHSPIWMDRWSVALLALAILANAGLGIFLWQRFETFPDLIALHYNAFGEADIIGNKSEIYRLPLIGTIIWSSNAALAVVASRYDRVMARATLTVGLVVQVMFAAGAWRILT
jgi:hypothetical protein